MLNRKEYLKSLSLQIQQCEDEVIVTSQKLHELKAKLKALQHSYSSILGIKWVDEIRRCFSNNLTNKLQAVNISAIAFNISTTYNVDANDRNVRNKIATTLSRMYKDYEIYKAEYKGKTVYGPIELFEDDGVLEKGSKVIVL